MLFLLVLKWKLQEKAFSNVKTKTNSNFAVRSNHSFLLSIWWIRLFRHLYDNGIKRLNWLCRHMKNVRSGQPCISINFCTEFSKAQVFPVSIVKSLILFINIIWSRGRRLFLRNFWWENAWTFECKTYECVFAQCYFLFQKLH